MFTERVGVFPEPDKKDEMTMNFINHKYTQKDD